MYGINWAHKKYGFDSPCVSGFVIVGQIYEQSAHFQLKAPYYFAACLVFDMVMNIRYCAS